ncbi:hypothetical protein DH2020_009713 [Rehmannia glutinosa]|uniref:RING-type domain-containing protein n=1 Tax=Rehmannia glutinosa TaxID=99300 RepID=A0ABR0X7P1_REHGL
MTTNYSKQELYQGVPPQHQPSPVELPTDTIEIMMSDEIILNSIFCCQVHVHLKPRTTDVSSQQFVEATIRIRVGPQYPEAPSDISVIDSKGLDEQRQKHLLASIRGKALELASCLMLVALCEEAVERPSSMNHPEGDCPLCLHPLVDEDVGSKSLPFMKLMSCYHCFHCDCIIRWWNWTQVQSEEDIKSSSSSSSSRIMQHQQVMRKTMEENMGKCPVCRKVFLAKDIEHVLDLVGTGSHLVSNVIDIDEELLHSESEKIRRQKFEAILKLQQENSGLIEPKKNEVLLPGMFLPQSVALPSTESGMISSESRSKDPAAKSDTNPGSSFNRRGPRKHNNSNMRKHKT